MFLITFYINSDVFDEQRIYTTEDCLDGVVARLSKDKTVAGIEVWKKYPYTLPTK